MQRRWSRASRSSSPDAATPTRAPPAGRRRRDGRGSRARSSGAERPAARAETVSRGRGSKSARAWPRRSVRSRARPARRSSGLHAAVRPRARRRTRAGGGRRRARHLALSLRGRAGAGRIPTPGALLSPLVAPLRPLGAAPAAQGGGASAGARPRSAASHADVLHMQWLPVPELDAFLFRPHLPSVLTAHDLLPRRTAHRTDLWRRLFAALRPDRRAQRERPARPSPSSASSENGCG